MSEYPEYEQLQELRAEDRRRRAIADPYRPHSATPDEAQLLATDARDLHARALQRSLLELAYGMHDQAVYARFLRSAARGVKGLHGRAPRWYRRHLTRTAARHDAISRTYRRALVETNRAYHPPVIKKGLQR